MSEVLLLKASIGAARYLCLSGHTRATSVVYLLPSLHGAARMSRARPSAQTCASCVFQMTGDSPVVKTLIAVLSVATFIAVPAANAKGGGKVGGPRPGYGGSKHTNSHGGRYQGATAAHIKPATIRTRCEEPAES